MSPSKNGRRISAQKLAAGNVTLILTVLVLLVVSCAPGSIGAGGSSANLQLQNADGYTGISVEQLASMLDTKDFTLLNVHIPFEGDIPATDLSIPFNEIADRVSELPDQDAKIVLYCRSGSMSTTAAGTLASLGYSNVLELDGGMRAWEASGYTLEGREDLEPEEWRAECLAKENSDKETSRRMNIARSNRKRVGLALIVALVAALGLAGWAVGRVSAQGPWGGYGGRGMMGGYGPGMMGDWSPYGGDCRGGMMGGYGVGMMGGHDSGMMGGYGYGGDGGCGMMGTRGGAYPGDVETLTMEEALESVERYLLNWRSEDLEVAELMEFSGNFYALVKEESTGIGAFELLVDKVSGAVSPEHGPNMMWNLKYGMMGGYGMRMGMMGGSYGGMLGRFSGPSSTADMPIDEDEAVERAQDYLEHVGSGLTADEEADAFYGYYTLHVLTDAEVSGMLSVNRYSGQVWYHNWHGEFVDMIGHGK